jgi:hypothetical protein
VTADDLFVAEDVVLTVRPSPGSWQPQEAAG